MLLERVNKQFLRKLERKLGFSDRTRLEKLVVIEKGKFRNHVHMIVETQRGKTWSNSSVHSVLKRMHERDVRIEGVRNKKYPIKISKMVVRCHTV